MAGPASGKTNPAGELNGVEKDRSIRPLGRARAAALVAVWFDERDFPRLWFPSGWRLSPLFSQDDQILFFPAPISYLGERHFPSRIIEVLVRTVLQLGFTVQSSGKKRCGRRVVKLRRQRARLHSLRKNSCLVSGPDFRGCGKSGGGT